MELAQEIGSLAGLSLGPGFAYGIVVLLLAALLLALSSRSSPRMRFGRRLSVRGTPRFKAEMSARLQRFEAGTVGPVAPAGAPVRRPSAQAPAPELGSRLAGEIAERLERTFAPRVGEIARSLERIEKGALSAPPEGSLAADASLALERAESLADALARMQRRLERLLFPLHELASESDGAPRRPDSGVPGGRDPSADTRALAGLRAELERRLADAEARAAAGP